MLNNLFTGIFDTAGAAVISVPDFLLCIVVSLLIGAFITWVYTYKNRYTTSFAVTLAMLPAIVCIVIMMVNGNVGAGVAVAGAFFACTFPFCAGNCKRDRNHFSCNGGRTDRRDGLSWVCSTVFAHYGSRDVCVKCDRIRCKKRQK